MPCCDHDQPLLAYAAEVSLPGNADTVWWHIGDLADGSQVGIELDRLAANIEFDRDVPVDSALQQRCAYAVEIRYLNGALLVSMHGEARPVVLAGLLRRIGAHVFRRATISHPLLTTARDERLDRIERARAAWESRWSPVLPS